MSMLLAVGSGSSVLRPLPWFQSGSISSLLDFSLFRSFATWKSISILSSSAFPIEIIANKANSIIFWKFFCSGLKSEPALKTVFQNGKSRSERFVEMSKKLSTMKNSRREKNLMGSTRPTGQEKWTGAAILSSSWAVIDNTALLWCK